MKHNQKPNGFTLIDLLIVVAVLFVIGALFLPSGGRSRSERARAGTRIQCVNNLKQVGLAFRVWAGEHQDKLPTQVSITNGGAMEAVMADNVAAVFQVMSNELNTPKILFCPTDKKRIRAVTFDQANSTFSNTNVTYFVGLDATETLPSMFLSGDDNFLVGGNQAGFGGSLPLPGILSLTTNTPVAWNDTRHQKQGNVGLADGSVQGFSSSALRTALKNTGVETNRLALP